MKLKEVVGIILHSLYPNQIHQMVASGLSCLILETKQDQTSLVWVWETPREHQPIKKSLRRRQWQKLSFFVSMKSQGVKLNQKVTLYFRLNDISFPKISHLISLFSSFDIQSDVKMQTSPMNLVQCNLEEIKVSLIPRLAFIPLFSSFFKYREY